MRIVGLDLSLSCSGVATWDRGTVVEEHTYAVKPTSALNGVERLLWIRDEIGDLVLDPDADLVLIEGYAYTQSRVGHALGELGGVVKAMLHQNGLTVAVVPPTSLKKYATGKGNASKEQVLSDVTHRAGRVFATTDEADAWVLCQMGLARLGVPHVQMPAAHRVALDGVEWPDLEALEVPA